MARRGRDGATLTIVNPTSISGGGSRALKSGSTAVATIDANVFHASPKERVAVIVAYGLSESDDIVIANCAYDSTVAQGHTFTGWNSSTYEVVGVRAFEGRDPSVFETMHIIGAKKNG